MAGGEDGGEAEVAPRAILGGLGDVGHQGLEGVDPDQRLLPAAEEPLLALGGLIDTGDRGGEVDGGVLDAELELGGDGGAHGEALAEDEGHEGAVGADDVALPPLPRLGGGEAAGAGEGGVGLEGGADGGGDGGGQPLEVGQRPPRLAGAQPPGGLHEALFRPPLEGVVGAAVELRHGLGDEGGIVLEGEVGPAEAGGEVGVAGGEGAAGAEQRALGLVAGVEVLGRGVAVLADLPGHVGQQIVEEAVVAFEPRLEAEVAAGAALPEALRERLGELAAGQEADLPACRRFHGGGEALVGGGGAVLAHHRGPAGGVALDDEPITDEVGHHAGHDDLARAVVAAPDGLEEVAAEAGGHVEQRELDAPLGGGAVGRADLDVVPHVVDLDDLPAQEPGARAGDGGEEGARRQRPLPRGGERPLGGEQPHEVGLAPPRGEQHARAVGAHGRRLAPGELRRVELPPRAHPGDGLARAEAGEELIPGAAGDALILEDQAAPELDEGGVGGDPRGGGVGGRGHQRLPPAAGTLGLAPTPRRGLAVKTLQAQAAEPRVLGGEACGDERAPLGRGGEEGVHHPHPFPQLPQLTRRQTPRQPRPVLGGDGAGRLRRRVNRESRIVNRFGVGLRPTPLRPLDPEGDQAVCVHWFHVAFPSLALSRGPPRARFTIHDSRFTAFTHPRGRPHGGGRWRRGGCGGRWG